MSAAPAILWQRHSTNGRWGIALVGPAGAELPCQGSVRHLGQVAGVSTWLLEPGETGTWVIAAGDITVHGGATVAESMDLQSSDTATILVLGPQAVVEHHGYKRRSSDVLDYIDGQHQTIPGPVLLAMGLLQPQQGEVIAVEPPPVLRGAMAAAFASLKRAA